MTKWISIADGYYSVSDSGEVRSEPVQTRAVSSHRRGRVLKQGSTGTGYPQITLCIPGKKRARHLVHRLIAEAFLGPCPEGHQVNHKDGDKSNNCVENLEYVTQSENIRHAVASGLYSTKLTAKDVRMIRDLHTLCTQKFLAEMFNVSQRHISSIVNRRQWAHVT